MPEISEKELNRLKQAVEELSTLNRIANTINVTMSVDKISSIIVENCCKKVMASQGAIFLHDEEDEANKFSTFVREVSGGAELPFHLNNALLGWMLANKSILVSNDPDNDDRLKGVNFESLGIKTVIAAPLLSKSGLIGLLVLFNKTKDSGFDEPDKRFLGIVGTQVSKVIENARLFEKETRLEIIEKDIKLANSIQQGFLPKENLKNDQYEIYGYNSPAKEVGGDYYDIIELGHDNLFLSIGDISGKGMPAALLMGNAQAVLRSQLLGSGDVQLDLLADCLNKLICQFTSPEQYLTAVFGVYYGAEKIFKYINAGHLLPIIIKGNGEIIRPTHADLVVGVLPDFVYQAAEVTLEKGDSILLFTDGVNEAFNEAQEEFGEDRLEDIIKANHNLSPKDICNKILQEIVTFRGKALQSDDVTILAMKLE